jgi:long-subunit fatty acid transport protein
MVMGYMIGDNACQNFTRFEGQLIRQYDSPYDVNTGIRTATPWVARGADNFSKFVKTGIISTNNVAVSATGTNYNLRMSYTHMYQKGMFPNTKLNSDNMNLNLTYNINPKLTVEGNMNFNMQYTPNIPDVSYTRTHISICLKYMVQQIMI